MMTKFQVFLFMKKKTSRGNQQSKLKRIKTSALLSEETKKQKTICICTFTFLNDEVTKGRGEMAIMEMERKKSKAIEGSFVIQY